jgi:cell division protein FtsZ
MSSDTTGLILVGIGGGGCRMVAAACRAHGEGLAALGFDTDEAASRSTPGVKIHLIGATRLNKQGAGGVHSNGRLAAQDDLPNILTHLKDARVVVVVACLGGGTGGGATPVILQALRAEGKLTLCFVTTPFAFEGAERRQMAERDRPLLEQHADTLVQVSLDALYAGQEQQALAEASHAAEAKLASGLCLLWRLLLTPGFISFDPARLQNMIDRAGLARFGVASATGVDRSETVVAALTHSPLLLKGAALSGARALALGILAGEDLRLAEVGAIMDRIRAGCPKDVHIEMGVVLDACFDGRLELVALAFEQWLPAERRGGMSTGGAYGVEPLGKERPRDSKLQGGSGKFRGVEKTVIKGEDFDIPTYQRQHIRLER